MKALFSSRGLEEYIEDIQQAGKDIDAAVQRALTAGGAVMLDGMRDMVPVDQGDLLKALVINGPYQDGNLISVEIGIDYDAPAEIHIIGGVQEYGSPSKHIPPQSYIRAAWDRFKRRTMKAIVDSLKADRMVDA
jgi:hypothetical protein